MLVIDLVGILLALLLVISFYRAKVSFVEWLFEVTGFCGYFLKALSLLVLLILLIVRVDWSFLLIKLF